MAELCHIVNQCDYEPSIGALIFQQLYTLLIAKGCLMALSNLIAFQSDKTKLSKAFVFISQTIR